MNELAPRRNEPDSGSSFSYMEIASFLAGAVAGGVGAPVVGVLGGQYLSVNLWAPEEELPKGKWFAGGPVTAGYTALTGLAVPAVSYLIFGSGSFTKGVAVGAVLGGGVLALGYTAENTNLLEEETLREIPGF